MATQKNYRNNGAEFIKKASTAFEIGDLCTIDSDGFLIPGGSGKIVGVSNEKVTSADADYAVARGLNVSAGDSEITYTFNVATGTATQTIVGEYVDIDATDKTSLDITASTNDQVFVTKFINATTVEGKLVA
jgi:hypothetical protein